MIRKALAALPDGVRLPLMRSFFTFDVERTEAVRCTVARGVGEHRRAFEILRRAYGGAGFTLKYRSDRVHYTVQHLLPTSNVVVARVNGEIVGTASSVHDSALGLLAEGQYADVIRDRREAGERIVEAASVAVDQEHRGHGEVLFALVRYTTLMMMDYEHADAAVATMNRFRTDLLRALFLFEPLTPGPIAYPTDPAWRTWPVIEDFRTIEARGVEVYGGRPLHRNLEHFMFKMGRLASELPKPEFFCGMAPRLTPDEYLEVFGGDGSPIPGLDERQRLVVQNARGPELDALFPDRFPVSGVARRDVRFEASGTGTLASARSASPGGSTTCELRDVSRRGALVRTSALLSVGQEVSLYVAVGHDRWSTITARVARDAGASRYGLQLTHADDMWDSYLDYLHAWLWGRIFA